MGSPSGHRGAAVRIEHISKAYGEVPVVRDVSLEARAGEFLTLLGPSGSGKSTLLMMIAGFVMPSSGDIYLDDRSITYERPHRRNISMVFQSYALFPHMRVDENIAFPLRMRRLPESEVKEKISWALRMVKLESFRHHFPRMLSGGQQQRIALARALVADPPVILMDEPLGALDKKLREHMQIEIKQIQESLGVTVIYVTHDQSEALTMSDRIAVMNLGQLEQVGTPNELYEHPRNRFIADFIGETNLLRGQVVGRSVEGVHLHTEAGVTLMAQDSDRVEGTWVDAAVRPERVQVLPARAEVANCHPAVIEQIVYTGESRYYHLRLADSETLVVARTPNTPAHNSFARGDRVYTAWNVEDVVLLDS